MQASSGGTTLLFTDIEGSTQLWDRQADKMSGALARHDEFSRSAVEQNHGTIVKMTGDGMYAAFDEPVDALNATLMLQKALADPAATNGIALNLRFGMHVGVVERRNNDLFGSPVNRAARIMSSAHGGQILLSQAVADCVRDRMPPETSLLDLGVVRLRDLSTPDHVYQLVHPQLRASFPALRSLEATPNNLPQQLTSFIGRERELGDAKRHLESTRLLTLLGMGGLGKTRLSLQIAADLLDKFPDGVWFLDLAPIQDPALVPSVTAQVLNVHEEPGKPILQTLCAHVQDHKALFVIDNCEHLVSACAHLANALLRAAPNVRMLATSREALHIPGEQTYPVMPLAVPDKKGGLESALRSDAVQLFVERARLHKPAFVLGEREAPAVAEIVARLEGIPLALELAAARLRSMSIDDINTRLKDRFKLLTGGSRVLMERQQTLRALVQWSYDLLQENEMALLDRLSIFAGGFDLAAAEAVGGVEPLDPYDVVDLVASLVEKSLVMIEHGEGESRYGMLETIREFSRERLQTRGDLESTAKRHCDYFFGFAKTARDNLQGAEQAEWTRKLEADLDNIRGATALALAGGVDTVIAVKFAVALMRFWTLRGYSTEGRNLVRAALALPSIQEPNAARAFALYVGGVLATNQSDYVEAKSMLMECVEIRRRLENPREVAASLAMLAGIHLTEGDAAQARTFAEEALDIFRKLKEPIGEGIGLLHLGEICVQLDDSASAQTYLEQGLAIAKRAKHHELESDCERGLGDLALHAGDLATARKRYGNAQTVCQEAQDKRGGALASWRLGKADAASGDPDAARVRLEEALRAFESFAMNGEAVDCLEDYAELLQQRGQVEDAVCIYGAAAGVRESLKLPRSPFSQSTWTARIAAARAALAGEDYDEAWSAGGMASLEEAIERTLALASAPPVPA